METTVLFPPLSAFVCLAAYADEKYSSYCPTKSVCAISAVCSNLERTLNDFMREKKVKQYLSDQIRKEEAFVPKQIREPRPLEKLRMRESY